jgi:predicted nucleic acid-binding protein
LIYLDTSIVIAYYMVETHTTRVVSIYEGNDELAISPLVEIELASVLARLVRVGSVEVSEAQRVHKLFLQHVEDQLYTSLTLHLQHYQWARDQIAQFQLPLKAPDALHLAIAHLEHLDLLTADRQMARNAGSLSISVRLIEG